MRDLYFELIPPLLHGKAPRVNLSRKEWESIRRHVFSGNSWACAFCGSPHRLEAHEAYRFEGEWMILDDIVPACKRCHFTIHAGRASMRGQLGKAISGMAIVRGISFDEAEWLWNEACVLWERRRGVRNLDWSLLGRRPWREFLAPEKVQRALESAKPRYGNYDASS